MSNQPTDSEIVTFAVGLLSAGILASALPGRLMDLYSLTPEKASELAAIAIKRHKKQGKRGKLGTKPFDQGSQ